MVVFVFSNTYLTRAAIHFLEFMSLKSKLVEKICILSDSNTIDEFPDFLKNKLILKNTFQDCFESSDVCLIVKDENYENDRIDPLVSVLKTRKLSYYYVELTNNVEENDNEFLNFRKKPTVLILKYGAYTQQYCTELALARAFRKNGIGISQRFSSFTSQFIEKLRQICPVDNSPDLGDNLSVITCEIGLFENFEKDNKIREIIHYITPQYVILTTNNGVEITEKFLEHIHYLYGTDINCIVKSTFTPMLIAAKTFPMVSCYFQNTNTLFSEDTHLGNKLLKSIEEKLVIPKGIHMV